MNCQETQSKLLDYIDCEINEYDKKFVRNHLDICEDCNDQYLEWKETISTIKESKESVYDIEGCKSIKFNVMKRVELYEVQKKTFNKNIKVWNQLASIAAAFAIMFAGYAGYNQAIDKEQTNTSLAVEELQSIYSEESSEKKGDVVRIASNDEPIGLSKYNLKTVAPYSLGGVFLSIGAASIVMRRRLEKQLKELLK